MADEVVVNLMARACGPGYSDVAADAQSFELERAPIPVASKEKLMETKRTLRPLDAADRAYLEARIAAEKAGGR